MSNRALWATSTASPAKDEEAADREIRPRSPPHIVPADPGERRDGQRQRDARVDERLERRTDLERLDPLGADLDDARAGGREPGRLEIEDDERGRLERSRCPGRIGEPDRRAAPREPRVARDHVVEQRARDRRRRRGEGEERPRGLAGRNRAASRLDELHEPVGGIERELHPANLHEHMFV